MTVHGDDEPVKLVVTLGSEEEWERLEALIEEAVADGMIRDIQVQRA